VELSPQQVKEAFGREKVQILDIRGTEELRKGVIKGSLCIGFDGAFANWVGTLLDPQTELIIYGGNAEQSLETIKRLYRIGYINIVGHANFPLSEWKSQGEVSIPEFYDEVVQAGATILDVRKPGEWKDNGVVEGSIRLELSDLFKNVLFLRLSPRSWTRARPISRTAPQDTAPGSHGATSTRWGIR
jgi:hydroxyacylglutathione hydrolase